MKTISVWNIDERLGKALKQRARERGVSVNNVLLGLLKESLGIDKQPRRERNRDLDELAGTWSETDLREFKEVTRASREIDPELWQ